MSLRQLPEIRADFRMSAAQFDVRPDALERWQPDVRAADSGDASISIYDTIGDNWEGTGVTAKRISAALRTIGAKDITVNINSPGGDFFEGVAIYNLLRQHAGRVIVQVMGLAASAASIVAMAGDQIRMGDGAFLMIHNAWAVAIGNRHDLEAAAATLVSFDAAMAKVYAARASIALDDAAAMMDKETWMSAEKAVANGFADGILESATVTKDPSASASRRALAAVEAAMAKAGYSRAARRETFANLFADTPRAVGTPASRALPEPATPCAGDAEAAATLQSLIAGISG